MKRRHWDFGYEPAAAGYSALELASPLDVVIATGSALDEATLGRVRRVLTLALVRIPGALGAGVELEIETLIARAPLFWTRVRASTPSMADALATPSPDALAEALAEAGVDVRYVAPARSGSMAVAPPLDLSGVPVAQASDWAILAARPVPPVPSFEGQWFLGVEGGGVHVDRRVCGTGAGTRLAVIDDDEADLALVDLDGRVHVGTTRGSETSGHAALMVGWATCARRPDGTRFLGIAPDASPRLYAIPKPGVDAVSLALAIARAVFDGADVVVCATYVEGTTSPLLDDALDVAAHLGRGGCGTVVVLPTGRETASSGGSLHASLSLEFGDPASDPRVHCVAPGGRPGGWFLWQSPRGKLRPFANRGPAVRWLAPGDDLAYPFSSRDRLFHAESSGASAVAAGVMLLLLGSNPELKLPEVHAILARTVDAPNDANRADANGPTGPTGANGATGHDANGAIDRRPTGANGATGHDANGAIDRRLADPADVLPLGSDRDGHNAKCGYGRLNATRACASAADPVALGLAAIGEDDLAVAWRLSVSRPFSDRLGRWAARALLARPDVEHSVRAVLRHVRLVSAEPPRARAHAPGSLARQLSLVARELMRMQPPAPVLEELEAVARKLRAAAAHAPGPALEETARSAFRRLGGELAGAAVEPPAFSTTAPTLQS